MPIDPKLFERIVVDEAIMEGKAVIKGLNVPIIELLNELAEGKTFQEVKIQHPGLEDEDIFACFAYVSEIISQTR